MSTNNKNWEDESTYNEKFEEFDQTYELDIFDDMGYSDTYEDKELKDFTNEAKKWN